MKTFRAEVTREGERWVLRIPSLANLSATGERLIDAEQKLRESIGPRFGVEPGDVCIELQDSRGIARERARRPLATDVPHPAIRT
jgi:hypothetical protein